MPRERSGYRRRSCIAALGSIALAGLAGCSGGSSGTGDSTETEASGESGDPTATATPDPTATATPEPTATATPEPTATATSAPSGPAYGDWFSDVPNFEETSDETGQSEVTVNVGAEGGLVFSPPAIKVTTGTTVVWEWTGKGGMHNVVHDDGDFESEFHSEAGSTFERTFSSTGTYRYYCAPHKARGMKGAVYVVE
jgi:halocyanin-like protein